jgi:hypothetical protein
MTLWSVIALLTSAAVIAAAFAAAWLSVARDDRELRAEEEARSESHGANAV